jgi:hypothetical protein
MHSDVAVCPKLKRCDAPGRAIAMVPDRTTKTYKGTRCIHMYLLASFCIHDEESQCTACVQGPQSASHT